jgi:hypothetical protein
MEVNSYAGLSYVGVNLFYVVLFGEELLKKLVGG